MADIQTYSPRKVTDQNRDLLPSHHNPKKRTTYVQITLNEPEIKEAIRNYIRAQVPITPGDELPVKIIAGRGENGHSAEVIITASEYAVASPERPTAPMATFEAVAEDAARRNSEEPTTEAECEEIDEDVDEKLESFFVKTEAPPAEIKEEPKPVKKSSLFDTVDAGIAKSTAAAEAAKAAAAPPEADKLVPAPVSNAPMKAKSIFDV